MELLLKKHPMQEQAVKERIHNFSEVAMGYDEETATAEAERCLHCKLPQCRKGCPVGVDIPEFISKLKAKDYSGAIDKIKETNSLPAICGRVCPQENQCEKYCVLSHKGEAVAIGRLERFAADYALKHDSGVKNNIAVASETKKVAIIGSGPAGLSAAGALAKKGFRVTIFEALHKAGGVLVYGIPEFRLPKDTVVKNEIDKLKEYGVEIELNSVVGRLYTIDELMEKEGFSAVFIATGAGLPHFMGIPGEQCNGVYSANEFLTRINLMKAYRFPDYLTPINIGKRVAVVGGGNVAMDSARTALRLGAECVYIVYRRGMEELPARKEEIHHAREEGIAFELLANPLEVIGDDNGKVTGLKCIKMELGEPDASGRRGVRPVEGTEYIIQADTVIMAIGQGANPIISQTTPGLETDDKGHIKTDENGATSKPGVFAGGDIVTGAATVIMAMGAGKKAAEAIEKYLNSKN